MKPKTLIIIIALLLVLTIPIRARTSVYRGEIQHQAFTEMIEKGTGKVISVLYIQFQAGSGYVTFTPRKHFTDEDYGTYINRTYWIWFDSFAWDDKDYIHFYNFTFNDVYVPELMVGCERCNITITKFFEDNMIEFKVEGSGIGVVIIYTPTLQKPLRVIDAESGAPLMEFSSASDCFTGTKVDGWFYNPANHTLYIKRVLSTRTVRIVFGNPPAVAGEVEEVERGFYDAYIKPMIGGSVLDLIVEKLQNYLPEKIIIPPPFKVGGRGGVIVIYGSDLAFAMLVIAIISLCALVYLVIRMLEK